MMSAGTFQNCFKIYSSLPKSIPKFLTLSSFGVSLVVIDDRGLLFSAQHISCFCRNMPKSKEYISSDSDSDGSGDWEVCLIKCSLGREYEWSSQKRQLCPT